MMILHTRLNLLRDQEILRGKETGGGVPKVIPRRTQVLGAAAKEPSTISSTRQQQKQSVISQAPLSETESESESRHLRAHSIKSMAASKALLSWVFPPGSV